MGLNGKMAYSKGWVTEHSCGMADLASPLVFPKHTTLKEPNKVLIRLKSICVQHYSLLNSDMVEGCVFKCSFSLPCLLR